MPFATWNSFSCFLHPVAAFISRPHIWRQFEKGKVNVKAVEQLWCSCWSKVIKCIFICHDRASPSHFFPISVINTLKHWGFYLRTEDLAETLSGNNATPQTHHIDAIGIFPGLYIKNIFLSYPIPWQLTIVPSRAIPRKLRMQSTQYHVQVYCLASADPWLV